MSEKNNNKAQSADNTPESSSGKTYIPPPRRRLYINDIHPEEASQSQAQASSLPYHLMVGREEPNSFYVKKSSPKKKPYRGPGVVPPPVLESEKKEVRQAMIFLPPKAGRQKHSELYRDLTTPEKLKISPLREKMIFKTTGMSAMEYFKSLPERIPGFLKELSKSAIMEDRAKYYAAMQAEQNTAENIPDEKSVRGGKLWQTQITVAAIITIKRETLNQRVAPGKAI